MTWLLVAVLALAAFVLIALVFKAPRGGWEAIGAALLLGIAGYGLQGSPQQPASPKLSNEDSQRDTRAIVDARLALSGSDLPPTNSWIVFSDGLARNGRFAEAAEVLRGAVTSDPDNAEAWLAMGNALAAHADGMPTPAAIFAYRKASLLEPRNPAPLFFLGAALAQGGQFAQARELWAEALVLAPADAPWREGLADRLGQLDRFIAGQSGGAPLQ